MKEVQTESSKPGFNYFGLGDCKAPKVLGDIVESIAGAIFLDSGKDTTAAWKVIYFGLKSKLNSGFFFRILNFFIIYRFFNLCFNQW